MPRKARVVSIDLRAGTARFFTDLNEANAKIRQFGHGAVSDMQASSAAIRELMGGGNVRAVEKFVGSVLGLAPILKAAFPVVGAIAFGQIIADIGKKTYDFFKAMQLAPEITKGVFRELNESLLVTNDQLAVSNDRLENEIAKLEGKHENTLKLSLDEARLAADRLAESLDRDIKNLDKLLREQSDSKFKDFFSQMFGKAGTSDIAREIGGESGFGGFRGQVAGITEQIKLLETYDAEINKIKGSIASAQKYENDKSLNRGSLFGFGGEQIFGELKARMEALNGVLRQLQEERTFIERSTREATLKVKKDSLEASAENAKQDRPFEDRMKSLAVSIETVQAKLNAIGKPEAAQVIAKAFGESMKAIEETNKALERHHTQLTNTQKDQILAAESTLAQTEATEKWQSTFSATTTSIGEHITSLDLLTAAIGRGYEATKQANVETRLMQVLGEHANDPAWLQKQAGGVAGIRAGIELEFDKEHNLQLGQTISNLGDQVEMEKALAAAQKDGAEAVRQAGLKVRLRQLAIKDASADEIKAERDLYDAQRLNVSSENLAKLNEKIEATQRLTKAIMQGADAMRQANLENRLIEIRRSGGGKDEENAARRQDSADHAQQTAETAVQADRLRAIDEQIKKLQEAKATLGDTLAIEIQLRDLENQRIQELVKESLGMRGARDGVRAFFLEMQEDAKSSAQIVYDALNSSLDRVSANLAKLFTGKKTDWGKAFEEIGGQMVESTIKSSLQKGLGALGKHFGIDIGGNKPDGTRGNPIWVQVAGGAGAPGVTPGVINIGGGSSGAGSGDGIMSGVVGMVSHMLPGRASGGPVYSGEGYMVGEHGPEPFFPSSNGTIIPHGALSGGGPTHVEYHIDARGADLGVMNRIRQGMRATHDQATADAVRAVNERSKRVPGR